MYKTPVLGVIPARFASSRLPGKLLKEICGKSILQRVYEQCKKAKSLKHVLIVTDHNSILQHALSFGADVALSKKEHSSGTDRIAELVESLDDYSQIINIQGDEPFIDPENIDILVNSMLKKDADIGSLAIAMSDAKLIKNPNFVKVVTDLNGRALYFSRAEIPFLRERNENVLFRWNKHIGIYGFKRETLLKLTKLPISALEHIECLEQLRWLENGYQIHIEIIDHHAIGIDTQEDLVEAIKYASENNL